MVCLPPRFASPQAVLDHDFIPFNVVLNGLGAVTSLVVWVYIARWRAAAEERARNRKQLENIDEEDGADAGELENAKHGDGFGFAEVETAGGAAAPGVGSAAASALVPSGSAASLNGS